MHGAIPGKANTNVASATAFSYKYKSSGLTLTAAHTVFIVEPVLNDALERQAISRVHRIGQTQEVILEKKKQVAQPADFIVPIDGSLLVYSSKYR